MPNVFTPNNDGTNDIYTPTYLSKNVNQLAIIIRNRWGKLFFIRILLKMDGQVKTMVPRVMKVSIFGA